MSNFVFKDRDGTVLGSIDSSALSTNLSEEMIVDMFKAQVGSSDLSESSSFAFFRQWAIQNKDSNLNEMNE